MSSRALKYTRSLAGSRLATHAALPALLISCAPLGAAWAQGTSVGNAAACPWLDTTLPVATRVNLLLSKMSIADEIALVQGNGSSNPYVFFTAANPALCIPAGGYEDGPEGVADSMMNVTQLPSDIALASTFSLPLALQYGAVIGQEQASKGSTADLGPTVNIDRDPRWGRTFESLSEDPQLSAGISSAEIIGMQGQRVEAQVKHFDAYNQETNRNTQQDDVIVSDRVLHEIYQPSFSNAIDVAGSASLMCAYSSVNGFYSCQSPSLLIGVLRNEYNFQGLVMSDYGAIHDTVAATAGTDSEQPENTYFGTPLQAAVTNGTIPRAVLNSMVEPIVRELFRFDFFNNPPSGSPAAIATTPAHVALANTVAETGSVLLQNSGALLPLTASDSIAVIGPAASTQAVTGGGGSAHVDPSSTVTPLAGIEAAATGAVTYNQGLPTDAQLTPVPSADLSTPYAPTNYGGSYSATLTAPETGTYIIGFTNPGSYNDATLTINGTAIINNPGTPPVAVYSAAVQLTAGKTYSLTLGGAGPTSNLAWATPTTLQTFIGPAVAAAKAAKEAVVVVADDTESEAADRANLQLPSAQDALIEAVAAANPHTVVVVQAGAPITMPWLGSVASVLDTWYPGQTDGTALASLLFGQSNPSGHLPITFPASLADVPASTAAQFPGVNGSVEYSEGLLVGYRYYEAQNIKPLFPFGFGLSYTSFGYSDLQIQNPAPDGVTPVVVTATVTNTGNVAGTDVAQMYLGFPAAAGEPPRKLVGFEPVTLSPGQSTKVSFTVNPRDEWWWDASGWNETAGAYTVSVGDSSATANLPLTGSYALSHTIGLRHVTVTAAKSYKPGTPALVSVTLGAGGDETLDAVKLALAAPLGWKVNAVGPATRSGVLPGQAITENFYVTPPTGGVAENVTLYGKANLLPGYCAGQDAVDPQTTDPVAFYRHVQATEMVPCIPVRRAGGVRTRVTAG